MANFIVALMTIFRPVMTSWTQGARAAITRKALLLLPPQPLATESGPSNLCYNPFGSRGDGTFGRHQPAAGEANEEKKQPSGKRIKQPAAVAVTALLKMILTLSTTIITTGWSKACNWLLVSLFFHRLYSPIFCLFLSRSVMTKATVGWREATALMMIRAPFCRPKVDVRVVATSRADQSRVIGLAGANESNYILLPRVILYGRDEKPGRTAN